MNEIVNFIKNNPNWEELLAAEPYCLSIQRDGDYILFKYNQIHSDFSSPVVQEARGIIFHEPTWECVCRPFRKFFNYGEANAAEINWSKAVVSEKIDGSLIKLWMHNGEMHISTNGTIDAGKAQVSGFDNMSFKDLFFKALAVQYIMITPGFTYLYELVSPYNRVVIPYEDIDIYQLAIIDNITGEEYELDANIKKPKEFQLSSFDEVLRAAQALDWKNEGFVVFDGINRVKVKSPAYVLAHYARNNNVMTTERLLDVILMGEEEEFLTYADEYQKRIEAIVEKKREYDEGVRKMLNDLSQLLPCGRKQFAGQVMQYPSNYRPIAFIFYDHSDLTYEDIVKDWNAKKWERMLF